MYWCFLLFNISTGEAGRNADDAVSHMELSENLTMSADETDIFGGWLKNCFW